MPPQLPLERWALTPPFHPYLSTKKENFLSNQAVCFLLHFPSDRLESTVPRFRKARYPMASGLSSIQPTSWSNRDRPGSGGGKLRLRSGRFKYEMTKD